jgi:phosphoglycolate phosphatase
VDILNRENLLDAVDVIIGYENVKDAKPDPEGLLKVINQLGVTKDQILYIGDSIIDAQTAVNAGVQFIGLLTGTTSSDDFKIYKPIAVFDSLRELRLYFNI